MTWSPTPVNGANSVATNKAPLNNAFTYIDTTMKVDHLWDNATSTYDGHHNFIQAPKQNSTPTLDAAGGMQGSWYVENITQNSIAKGVPYGQFRDTTNGATFTHQYGLVLGSLNTALDTNGANATVRAAYNFTAGTYATNTTTAGKIQRTAIGQYTFRFTTAVPHNGYVVTCLAMPTSAGQICCQMDYDASYSNIVTTALFRLRFTDSNGAAKDPTNIMLTVTAI